MKRELKFCAGDNHSVSAMCYDGKAVATPTRHFRGTYKYLKCELYGKIFRDGDEAFAAMHQKGYGQIFYKRSSVPLPTFAALAHVQRECRFDALYRLFKHKLKTGRNVEQTEKLRTQIRKLAKEVGIFHPVANHWNKSFISPI